MASYDSSLTTPESVVAMMNRADPGSVPSPNQAEYAAFFNLIKTLIPQASRQIKTETNRNFVPYRDAKATYFVDLLDERKTYRTRLELDDDLLNVSQIVWGTQTLTANDWRPIPSNAFPIAEIRFNSQAGLPIYPYDENAAITITGIWGYHEQPAQAWTFVETIAGSITSGQTTITVANGAAYELLQYLRFENEYVQVVAKTTAPAHTITVLRGVNGTTAAAHSAFAIERWNVMADVAYACAKVVIHQYQNRGTVGNIQLPDGALVIPNIQPEITNILRRYTRMTMRSV